MDRMFCRNCGEKINDGDQFCHACGAPVNETQLQQKREQEYTGKLIKCPNCGEVLNSFTANCPACGWEVRGARVTSSVQEFAVKLEAIEANREREKTGSFLAKAYQRKGISKTDEQIISLIKNFSVPNTKEDILEFMILATSNIDMSMYSSLDTPTEGSKAMTEAWNAKIKQVYAKAKNIYKSDPEFAKIQNLYDSCHADITKQKKKKIIKYVLLLGWVPLSIVIGVVISIVSAPKDEAKEIERLEAIVVEVQDALDNQEYKLALSNADSIDYQRFDIEMERKWDIQREYWVDKVLEEAAKNGIELEYTPTIDVDKANESNSSQSDSSSFVDGFNEGMQSGLDSVTENINEFNNNINNENSIEQQGEN